MKTLMQVLLSIFITMAAAQTSLAQQNPDQQPPAYLRYPTIPPFTLLGLDGNKITRDNISDKFPTVLMYFSPGCDHCQHQVTAMMAEKEKFRKVNLVMATYQPMEELKTFYKQYKLAEFPNLIIGRDEQFFFPPYYKMTGLPNIALYDKKQKLITNISGNAEVKTILQYLGIQ
ncbi:redoxin domain-containing protein [Flavihumibacter rivuli]|uniref:TlpA family protein disulfide reductase n=1 Tax=Flavihumibacter rivuli TaxID=2838156 RepID=UPI001BDF16A7|nr:redoxin domain-containing protein [Flavihumibacter rivuli]ULQ56837.1 redoxin domain-containing protein [Flavihumibacter rivuli]